MAVRKGDVLCLRPSDNDDRSDIEKRSDGSGSLGHLYSIPRNVPGDFPDQTHGPFSWDLRRSAELQKAVDALALEEVLGVEFSLTVADPRIPDCPLVACSVGFSRLTHYTLDEIIGKNCRFLLNGVPQELINETTRFKSRGFCISAVDGFRTQKRDEDLPDALTQKKPFVKLGEGEVLCVQTNAKKSGELFRNMFWLKAVDLDDMPLIVGLQAGLDEDFDDEGPEGSKLREACAGAFSNLDQNMSAVEQVLASNFWYSSAMRRQN